MNLAITTVPLARPFPSPVAQPQTTGSPAQTVRPDALWPVPTGIGAIPPDQAAAIARIRLSPDGGGDDPTVRVLKPYGVTMLPRGPAVSADPPT